MSEHDSELRRALGEATVPPEAERRIVEGALGLMASRQSVWPMRVALVAAAAAAVVVAVLWIGALRGRSGGAAGGGIAGKAQPAPLPPAAVGTVWTAQAATRAVHLGSHRLELSPHARLRFAAGTLAAPRLEVKQGRAAFAVAPVRSGQRCAVQTRQVVVSVLGTRFSVDVRPRCTRVEVQSGRVRAAPLRGAPVELGPSEERAFCDAIDLDAAGRQVQQAIVLARKGVRLAEAEERLADYLDSAPAGTYAEEAHYFLVLVKRRLGKEQEAIAQARTFLQRFPSTERAATLRAWLEKEKK